MAMIFSEDRNTGKMESKIFRIRRTSSVGFFFHERRQTYHEQSYSEFLFAEVLRIFCVMYFNPLKGSLFKVVYVAN